MQIRWADVIEHEAGRRGFVVQNLRDERGELVRNARGEAVSEVIHGDFERPVEIPSDHIVTPTGRIVSKRELFEEQYFPQHVYCRSTLPRTMKTLDGVREFSLVGVDFAKYETRVLDDLKKKVKAWHEQKAQELLGYERKPVPRWHRDLMADAPFVAAMKDLETKPPVHWSRKQASQYENYRRAKETTEQG